MDAEALDEIWRDANRERGHRPPDLAELVSIASRRGPLTWRDIAALALRDRRSELGRPLFLLEFVAELTVALAPTSILDPWVTTPTMLAAAHDAMPSARSTGLIINAAGYEIAKATASLDWRLGDPIYMMDDLADDRFDLVLLSPPLGARAPHDTRQDDPPSTKRELADLVLWRVASQVQHSGILLFHTSDNFLWAESRRRLQGQLAQRGLHVQAVVSVDGGLAPLTSIPTSLVLFGPELPSHLFIARLDQWTAIPKLVKNLISRQAADNPELGALITTSDFRGWRSFVLERELAELFGSHQLRPLGDVATVRRVELKPDRPYDAPPNCAFVPTLGFGAVTTAPPDLEGKKRYELAEVQLDPVVARAEYVAACLSSPVGKRLRESAAVGSTVPHLTASALSALRIPIPSIAVQERAIRAVAHLASMEAAVARLRSDLWRHPEDADRLLARLENEAKADPVRRWIDILPYPMASVLHRYTAERDSDAKVNRLLHFFEVTAEFGCAVLISILRAVPDLLDAAQPDIAKAVPPGRRLFDRADFGLWINLGRTLAKTVRRLTDDRDQRDRLGDAAEPAAGLMDRLADRTIWQVLDTARTIRNQRAHGGVVSRDQIAGWLSALEALLSDAEQALASGFEDIDLARADEGRFRSGLHVYDRAQRLRGPSSVFEEFEVRARVPLESEHLAFVSRALVITPVLKIVPLVRVGPSASSSRNACYFFDSHLSGDEFSYVSYHFEDQPRILVEDQELEQLARQLSATGSL